MHLPPPGDVEAVAVGDLGHPERDVFQRLAHQPVADVPGRYVFPLAAGKRAVVDGERHLHRRGGDLHEGQRLHRIRRADGIADGDVSDAGQGNDVSGRRFRYGHAGQSVELIQAYGLRLLVLPVPVIIAYYDLLILPDRAAFHPTDGDASHVIVVVDGGHQHLQRRLIVRLGFGDILQNGLEQGLEVCARHLRRVGGRAVPSGTEEHGGIQLLVGGVQIHQELEHLVDHLMDARVGTVDLVDDHDHPVPQFQRPLQDKPRLRHGAFRRVHQKDDSVDHLQDTFHFPAEIGVARRVDDVDLHVPVGDGRVLGKDGDAAFPFQVVGVHHPVLHGLVLPEHAGLLQHLVHQGRLAVVDVGDDRYVSQFAHNSTSV